MNPAQPEETRAYQWAARAGIVATVALAGIGAGVGALVVGGNGAWSAAAGVGVGGLSGVLTPVAMFLGHRKAPHLMAATVAGAWMAKILVIFVAMIALSRVDALHRGTFGMGVLGAVAATLAVDLFAVRRARVTYTGTGIGNGQS